MYENSLNIASWNVNGWANNNCELRECIIQKSDIDVLCVCETHLIGGNVINVEKYKWYGNNRVNQNIRSPKGSGGVGILVRKSIFENYNVSVCENNWDGIFGLTFKSNYNNINIGIFVCYLPPQNSIWGKESEALFAHLINMLYNTSYLDCIVICGDFNARIGNLQDFVSGIDNLPNRNVIDQIKAGHGESFIEFVKDAKLCILNGRITPEFDDYTCVSGKGASIVDYIMTRHNTLHNCKKSEVKLVSDLTNQFNLYKMISGKSKPPDHSLLMLTLCLKNGLEVDPQRNTNNM